MLATENEPYQVFVASAGSTFDFGAGIPITRKHVLTTASLVRGFTSWNIGYGSNSFNRLTYIESNVAYMHPAFNGNSLNNNLAIIVVPTAFPRTIVKPIRLPGAAEGQQFPLQNQEGRIVGFGLITDTVNATRAAAPNASLKTVYQSVSGDCARTFASTDVVRNFCASDDHPDAMNLCRGDVGDAFVVTRRGEKVLVSLMDGFSFVRVGFE